MAYPCGCKWIIEGRHEPTCLGEPYGQGPEMGRKAERVKFAEPDPPPVEIPSRNELIARGFLAYLKKCTTDDEAIQTLTALLDEIRSY